MLGGDVVLNSASISSPSYCWTREVKSERLNLLWPCVQGLEKLCGKQKLGLYERGHFLLLFYWDVSSQSRTWKTLKSMWLSQTLRVSFFIYIFLMNQLHFQRVWGGTAAHKELWRWHFGYPGTTAPCKSSQFYVCGESIKFYEVMVSNITKDISLWHGTQTSTHAKPLPEASPNSHSPPLLPRAAWFPGLQHLFCPPGYVQVKVWLCLCTSRAVRALAAVWWPNIFAIFAWRMCVPFPKDCTCPQGEVFFLDLDQHQAENFYESSSPIFPQTDFRCYTWSSLPSCPACLGLWPLSASLSISGILSWYFLVQSLQPLLCWLEQLPRDSQAAGGWAGNRVLAPWIPLKYSVCSCFPLLEHLPEQQHSAEAGAGTLDATSEVHPFIFGDIKEGHLWKWCLSSASRLAPAWSPLFWSKLEAKLWSLYLSINPFLNLDKYLITVKCNHVISAAFMFWSIGDFLGGGKRLVPPQIIHGRRREGSELLIYCYWLGVTWCNCCTIENVVAFVDWMIPSCISIQIWPFLLIHHWYTGHNFLQHILIPG